MGGGDAPSSPGPSDRGRRPWRRNRRDADPSLPAPPPRLPPAIGMHEAGEDAFAHAAVGDPEAPDRPEAADRLEDGAAGDDEVGAVGADAGIDGALLAGHRRQLAADRADGGEIEIRAVD